MLGDAMLCNVRSMVARGTGNQAEVRRSTRGITKLENKMAVPCGHPTTHAGCVFQYTVPAKTCRNVYAPRTSTSRPEGVARARLWGCPEARTRLGDASATYCRCKGPSET